MSNSSYYVLKYQIKQAIADNQLGSSHDGVAAERSLSAGQVQVLKQATREVEQMSQSVYCYALADMFITALLMKKFKSNSHLYDKYVFRQGFWFSCRCVFVYECMSYLSEKHMRDKCSPILAQQKADPLKQDLIEKMKEFE